MAEFRIDGKVFKFPGLDEILKPQEIQRFTQEKMTEVLANSEQNLNGGRDVDGAPLRSYSPSYAAYLRSIGDSTTVDLNLTGAMRASRQVFKIEGGAEVKFQGAHAGRSRRAPRSARGGGRSSRGGSRASRSSRSGREVSRSGRSGGSSGNSAGSNAQLAGILMSRGFTNWHAISQKDNTRILKEFFELFIGNLFKQIKSSLSK